MKIRSPVWSEQKTWVGHSDAIRQLVGLFYDIL